MTQADLFPIGWQSLFLAADMFVPFRHPALAPRLGRLAAPLRGDLFHHYGQTPALICALHHRDAATLSPPGPDKQMFGDHLRRTAALMLSMHAMPRPLQALLRPSRARLGRPGGPVMKCHDLQRLGGVNVMLN